MSDNQTEQTTEKTAKQPPAPTVWGSLQARDARALIEWLCDVLGFVPTVVIDGPDDTVTHSQLTWPEGGGIMMGSHKPGSEWSREPGTAGFYVVTDHVDELYEKVRAAGARITRPLADQDYGNREFAIADPEGNLWSFGPYRGEPIG